MRGAGDEHAIYPDGSLFEGVGRLHCGKRSLKDVLKSLHWDDVGRFVCIESLGCGLKKRHGQIVDDGNQCYKLPPLTAGLVQKANKFRRVKMACEYLIFPFLHTGSIEQLRRVVGRLRPQPHEAFLRLHVFPAEQAQVDWASVAFLLRRNHRASPLPALDLSCHPEAQALDVRPHNLETYDELAHRRDDDPEQ